MELLRESYGVLDNRFLSRSLGLLNPPLPISLPQEASVRQGLELLKQHKIGCLLITDSDEKLVGVFSERDVVLKVSLSDVNLDTTPLSALMTKNPQTTEMTASVAHAMSMMSHGGYRHVPIVDDENFPVGIITVKNIIDYIMQTVSEDLGASL